MVSLDRRSLTQVNWSVKCTFGDRKWWFHNTGGLKDRRRRIHLLARRNLLWDILRLPSSRRAALGLYVILTLWRARGANHPPYAFLHRSSPHYALCRRRWHSLKDRFDCATYNNINYYNNSHDLKKNNPPIIYCSPELGILVAVVWMSHSVNQYPSSWLQWTFVKAPGQSVLIIRFTLIFRVYFFLHRIFFLRPGIVKQHKTPSGVFLYCCSDCWSCPTHLNSNGLITWAIWAEVKRYSLGMCRLL